VLTDTYSENGGFYAEMAIAPGPGAAGGIVKTNGRYRMTGPNTVQVTYGDSLMCTTGCMAAPPNLVPAPGTTQSFDFQFRGNNQVVAQDGTVFVRVR
jgi:hypothetical protein